MTTRLSVIDRIIILLIALLLLAVAVPFIGYFFHAPWAQNIFDWVNFPAWETDTAQPLWLTALGITCVLGIIIGLALVIANLRTHRFSRGTASQTTVDAASVGLAGADDLHGRIGVEVGDLADAAADSIRNFDGVERVRSKVFFDNHQPTMQFDITAKPTSVNQGLLAHVDSVSRSLAEALPKSNIDVRYVLELLQNTRRLEESSV